MKAGKVRLRMEESTSESEIENRKSSTIKRSVLNSSCSEDYQNQKEIEDWQ